MPPTVTKQTYAGIFLVTFSTLMYEILLTRIFSVTMWYHFAFMAISIAMFGMTVGALSVYRFPSFFTPEKTARHLATSSLLFAASIIGSFITHIFLPLGLNGGAMDVFSLAVTYIAISVPFAFSGLCVSLALTRFPGMAGRLYAADLAGSAAGCIALIYILKVTDAPTAAFVAALLASAGGAFFASGPDLMALRKAAMAACTVLALFSAVNTVLAWEQRPLLRLAWSKGSRESLPLYEKWNSFSRIRVTGDPDTPIPPMLRQGLSNTYPKEKSFRQVELTIDSDAATVLTAYDGNPEDAGFLKYEVSNLAHYIRPGSRVFVIGTGGGKDVLSALVFGQKSVVGADINEDIIDTVNKEYGDFTGHLDHDPRVAFVNDEARSFLSRQDGKFGIIQASLIDTWAATAAGAFTLTENFLYTIEAWEIFLDHLTPDGVLTFTRWYALDNPGEIYRLTALANEALRRTGVADARGHIIIVRNIRTGASFGHGTMLVSKPPFSGRDIDEVENVARRMNFDIVLSPRQSSDPSLAGIASSRDLGGFKANFPVNISPPTDDSPFFFNMVGLKDALGLKPGRASIYGTYAVKILAELIVIVAVLTYLCIFVPLKRAKGKTSFDGAVPLIVYFAAIGFGFMFIEISQMQRLIIFLGHPTYGLSVVLFTLLLSSSAGSYFTHKAGGSDGLRPSAARLLILLIMLAVLGMFTPHAVAEFQGSTTAVRILIAAAMLFPAGFFMGTAFPIGMKLASSESAPLIPWLWGINGATSVSGSVLAVAMAMTSGITASYWTGLSLYAVAFAAFIWKAKENKKIW